MFPLFDCCIASIALPSRRVPLYAEPHFALRRKKISSRDGGFCVVKKPGKRWMGLDRCVWNEQICAKMCLFRSSIARRNVGVVRKTVRDAIADCALLEPSLGLLFLVSLLSCKFFFRLALRTEHKLTRMISSFFPSTRKQVRTSLANASRCA